MMEVEDGDHNTRQPDPWEAIQLPSTDETLTQLFPIGEEVAVKVNGYALDTRCMKDVFLHEIPFTVHTDKKNYLLHLKGHNNDVMKQKRRAACWAMLELIQKMHYNEFIRVAEGDSNVNPSTLKDFFVYDGFALFYSTVPLPQPLNGIVDKADFPPEVLELTGNRAERIEYDVKKPTQVWKFGADADNQRLRKTEPVLMFLKNLTWARVGDRHLHYGNKAFYKSHESQLMPGKISIGGMEKTIRPMGGQLVMQIDAKVSPFFAEMPLLQHIEEQIGSVSRLRDPMTAKRLAKALHGIAVETTHIKGRKTFQFSGFSSKDASSSKFMLNNRATGEKQEITVKDFFLEIHKVGLQYSNLPLVKEMCGTRVNHYPIEVLRIVGGQRIPNNKSTPELIEKLIKEAQMKPQQMLHHIEEQAYKAYLDGSKHMQLKHFGVKTFNSFLPVKGQIVAAPEIKMMGGQAAQRDGRFPEKWRIGQRDKYFRPAVASGDIYCLVVENCTNDARILMDRLIGVCKDRGMGVDEKKVKYDRVSSDPEAVASMMEKFKSNGKVSMVVYITKDKRDPVHNTIKLLESRTGVLTQHMCMSTAQQILQGKPLCMNNIAQKINQKLGGVNFDMGLSQQLRTMNPEMFNKANSLWFNGRTLFIGLALSHAGPQSFADRIRGSQEVAPSVVGIVYTLKEVMAYRGEYIFQSARKSTIENMTSSIVRALTNFHQSARDLPMNIVIFRSGMSEGEFKKAAFETEQVLAAVREVQNLSRTPNYMPSVTTIFIISGSNYRAVTANGTPDNLAPGTCLGRQAVNPDMKEFVMVPQRAIMGTARPIRCTVVREDKGRVGSLFSTAELKVMVNALCHSHPKVTAPVHAPGVLMAAEELAKRGRNNYNEEHQFIDDTSTTVSGGSGDVGGRVDVTKEAVDVQISELNKKLANNRLNQTCHFWA